MDTPPHIPWDPPSAEAPAEEEARRLRRLLAVVAEGAPAGILMLREGRAVYANRRFLESFGYEAEEAAGLTFESLMDAEEHRRLAQTFGSFPAGAAEAPPLVYRGRRKDGGELVVGCRVREVSGSPGTLLTWHMDISEWTRDREKLALSERRFRGLLDNLPEPYFQTDLDGVLLFVNKAARDVLSRAGVDDPLGKDVSPLFTFPEERERVMQAIRTGRKTSNEEIRLLSRDGTWSHALLTAQLVRDVEGRAVGMEGILRDISEVVQARAELTAKAEEASQALQRLKETQARLVQQEKMASLGTLMAGLAHEITNPVNFIAGNLSFLRTSIRDLARSLEENRAAEGPGEPPPWFLDARDLLADVRDAASDACEGIERIKDIVRNLRSFSRVGMQRQEPVDLEEALDSTLRFLVYEYRDRVTVEKRYAGVPPVTCRASEINQVLMNLLSNAFQAVEDGGAVTIETAREGEAALVHIRDTGAGIPPDVADSVFEPFFSTRQAGVGLGLSISWEIVARHGGELSFRSEPGRGATFTVRLPLSGTEAT